MRYKHPLGTPEDYEGPALHRGDLAGLQVLDGCQVAVVYRRGRRMPVGAFVGRDAYVVGMLDAAWKKGGVA